MESEREEEERDVERHSQKHGVLVRLLREKIRSGRKEDMRFEGEGGAGELH